MVKRELRSMARRKPNKSMESIIQAIDTGKDPDGFTIDIISTEIGRGVKATHTFKAGDFICEYRGILNWTDPEEGPYVFAGKYKGKSFWLDANKEDGSVGRLLNDNCRNPSAVPKLFEHNSQPHICFYALRDINPGEEITFNYDGTKSKTFPWRAWSSRTDLEMDKEDSEMLSSGTDWKPGSADVSSDETETETNTTQYRFKRTSQWISDQKLHPKKADDNQSIIPPSVMAPRKRLSGEIPFRRPTKRLPEEPIIKKQKKVEQIPKKQCYICGKSVININRHIREVHESSVPVRNETWMKTERGYIVKKCPVCGEIRERLRDHLKRTHRIVDNKELTIKMKQAQPVLKEAILKQRKKPMKNLQPKKNFQSAFFSDPAEDNIIQSQENTVVRSPITENPIQSQGNRVVSSPITENVVQKKDECWVDEPTLVNFNKWLIHSSHGKKTRDAMQHAAQVFKVWKIISKDRRRLHDILDIEKINLYWLSIESNTPPGTIRSYLSSLSLFMDYLILHSETPALIQKADACKSYIKCYSKTLNKQILERRMEVYTENIETMLTPEDVSTFISSDEVKRAKEILEKTNWQRDELTAVDFVKARDSIITLLLIRNGQRSGAILGITHENLKNCLKQKEGITIMVRKHKTGRYGPANIGIDQDLYQLLLCYVKLCTLVPNYDINNLQDPIFITWPKLNEKPGFLSDLRGVQRLCSKVIGKKFTATRLRKAIVTTIRESDPDKREELATHMNHLATTADRFYQLKKNRDKALEMSEFIFQRMSGGNKEEEEQISTTVKYIKETERYEIDIESCQFPEFTVKNCQEVVVQEDESSLCNYIPMPIQSPKDHDHTYISPVQPTLSSDILVDPLVEYMVVNSEEADIVDSNYYHVIYSDELYETVEICDTENHPVIYSDELYEVVDTGEDRVYVAEPVMEQTKSPSPMMDICSDNLNENLMEDNASSVGSFFSHGRRSFAPEEAKLLISLCEQLIESETANPQCIMRCLNDTEEGAQLMGRLATRFGQKLKQKLRDRIHTEIRKRRLLF